MLLAPDYKPRQSTREVFEARVPKIFHTIRRHNILLGAGFDSTFLCIVLHLQANMRLATKTFRRMALVLCSFSAIFSAAPGGSTVQASRGFALVRRAQARFMLYPPKFESLFALTPMQKARVWMYERLWRSTSQCVCDAAREVRNIAFSTRRLL
jgi:hypothetical protein